MNATVYLVNIGLKNNGKLTSDFKAHWCDGHAIVAYAHTESYAFSQSFGYLF